MAAKNKSGVVRATTSIAVTGGLFAGLAITQNAGAAPENAQTRAAAVSAPLALKPVTPAHSVRVAPKAAAPAKKKAKAAPRVSRAQARQALNTKPVKTVKSERAAKEARLAAQKKAAERAEKREIARKASQRAAERRQARIAAQQRQQAQVVRTQHAPRHHAAPQTRTVAQRQQAPAVRTQQAATHARTVAQRQAPAVRAQQTQRQQPQTRTVNTHRATPQVSRTAVRTQVSQPTRTVTRSAVAQQPTTRAASTTTAKTKASAPQTAANSNVVSIASRYTGIRYVYGGSTPATGLDCSGFVSYVFAQAGINLPHSSSGIKAMTTPVSNPQPGDLAFLPGHVAIYAGNGMVYEARNPKVLSGLYPVLSGMTFGRLR